MQKYQQQAQQLDAEDPLKDLRSQFLFPKNKIYFCGHSLGLQPKKSEQYIKAELNHWADYAVEGHFTGENPWRNYHLTVANGLAKLTGAFNSEVVAMNSLTTNLHLLLTSFYRPTAKRNKILIEAGAFPSDRYAVHSHVLLHGFAIEDAIVEIPANSTTGLLDLNTIESYLEKYRKQIALVLLPGVQFLTGQVLPMQKITNLVHRYDCKIGWDLAHAIGNIPLELHVWDCDFAIWCHYKYLNAGPGAIAGCFVHKKYFHEKNIPRLAGWWGHDHESRFDMPQLFVPIASAEGWQLSNPPIFQLAVLRASLEIFDRVKFNLIREKSLKLTNFLREMLQQLLPDKIQLITSNNPDEHGAQLSLRILGDNQLLVKRLAEKNIICDFRKPNIMRIAPIPLYNSFNDVYVFVKTLSELI